MKIRRIDNDERLTTALPLQLYAFGRSPRPPAELAKFREYLPYSRDNVTLVAEEDGRATAAASGIPMRQNVRGTVYPMAGIAGVTTHPLARRRGHARALMTELLGRMRDDGHAVSALYPFRPSFYQRFGYIGLPKARTVTFAPADLGPLLAAELPGEVGWGPIGEGYDAYRDLFERLLVERHGFAVFPDYLAARTPDTQELWLVTARAGGEVAGAVSYRISDHAGDLLGDHLLATGPLGRALLLQFFARHVDQVARVVVTVPPDTYPELWATDLAAATEARTAFPNLAAPMARVLSLDALAGMRVGPGRIAVEVVDDPFIAGRYVLAGGEGALEVTRGRAAGALPAATLTAAALSGLIYGVLDPDEIGIRGLGTVPDATSAGQLRSLWPARVPYLAVDF